MKIWEPKKEEVSSAHPVYSLENHEIGARIFATFHDGHKQAVLFLFNNFTFLKHDLTLKENTLRKGDSPLDKNFCIKEIAK